MPEAGYPLEFDAAGAAAAQAQRRPAASARPAARRRRGALEIVDRVAPDVVVGFGGYVSVPAYLAARTRGCRSWCTRATPCPASPTRLGARIDARTSRPASRTPRCRTPTYIGLPIRRMISDARPRRAARRGARDFGLDARPADAAGHRWLAGRRAGSTRPSPVPPRDAGRRRRPGAARRRPQAASVEPSPSRGVPVRRGRRTSTGWTWPTPPPTSCCAAPAATPSPRSPASGCPAVYVPLPIGNGEQALNARPVVEAGGGLLVDDAGADPELGRGERARRWLTDPRPAGRDGRRGAPTSSRSTPTRSWPAMILEAAGGVE